MSNHYELWMSDEGYTMLGVPHPQRGMYLQEPGMKLLLRFQASTVDDARDIKDRFLYKDNPDGLVAVNLLANQFLIETYDCGLKRGALIRLDNKSALCDVGGAFRMMPNESLFEVLSGDIETPKILWLRALKSGSSAQYQGGQFASLDLDTLDLDCFSILSTAEPKAATARK
jgi:hypothetical protein